MMQSASRAKRLLGALVTMICCAAFAGEAAGQVRPQHGGTGSNLAGTDDSFLVGKSAGGGFAQEVPSGTCSGSSNYLRFSTAGSDGARLTCDTATGGSSPWTSATGLLTHSPTTDDVVIGLAQKNTAKVSVDGDTDQVQLSIQGHSSQTTNLMTLEKSDGTDVFTVDNNGAAICATPAADDNDTSAATTAFVQTEIQDAADDGRSLTGAATGVINADLELYRDTKCLIFNTPEDGWEWLFFRAETAITITGIDCVREGGTAGPITVKECNADGGSCTNTEAQISCGTTNTTEASTIDDSAVDAGDWMRIAIGTTAGAVTQIAVCVTFTWND